MPLVRVIRKPLLLAKTYFIWMIGGKICPTSTFKKSSNSCNNISEKKNFKHITTSRE